MPLSDLDVGEPPRASQLGRRAGRQSGVTPDDPTRRSTAPARVTSLAEEDAIDAALASAQKPIGPRLQSDLWRLVGERADALGISARLLLSDALVRALELTEAEHREHVRNTDQRERMAAARRPNV